MHRGVYEGMGGRESAALLKARLEMLEAVNDEMVAIFVRRCGFRLGDVLAGGEIVLTAFSAVSHGLVRKLTSEGPKASAGGAYSAPRNLPAPGGSTLRRHPSRPPLRNYR